LLPQQSKNVPDLYPVDKYNTSKGSIAENMNTDYFASNKSYPEPKIIEYDIEETSTESSPQHTSSLYSESTDQDSESIPSNVQFSKQTSNKNTECHVTKESKTIAASNQEFPVPSQFADLSLNEDNSIIDDDIEDIKTYHTDDTNQKEIEPISENQENPESQFFPPRVKSTISPIIDCYANTISIEPIVYKYEKTQSSPSIISNNKPNNSQYNVFDSSNIQNSSQFNTGSYFSVSNTLTQPNLLNSSISQSLQSKSFPYSNTELLNRQQESPKIQHHNEGTQSGTYNRQNKHIESVFQNSIVPPNDSKVQSNVNSSITQNKQIFNQYTSQAQVSNDHNNYQSINTNVTNLVNQPHSMYSSSKPPVAELLSDDQSISSQQLTSLSSSQSVDPMTSTTISTPKSSSISEDTIKEIENTSYQIADEQTSLSNFSNVTENSSIGLINQNSTNGVKSEFANNESVQSLSNNLGRNQQETMIDQSKSIDKQSNESQQNNITSLSPIQHITQPTSYFNSKNTISQQESNFQKTPIDQFDDIKISNNSFSNKSINVHHLENTTIQQKSISTTCHNIGKYFNTTNVNNQSVFNQQLPNLQSCSQQQNMHSQDIKSVSSSLSSNRPDNFMTFSNSQNTSINLISKQQQSSIKQELDNVQLNSDTLTNEIESVTIQPNNVNVKPLENTKMLTSSIQTSDNIIPNNQFSNIDNQQNIPINQTFNQEQITSISYFSKNTSFNNENTSGAFQNYPAVHNTNNLLPESPEVNLSIQTNAQSSNVSKLTTHLPSNNETVSDKIPIDQPTINQFSPELFGNKTIINAVPSVSLAATQSPSQMFSNQSKLDLKPPFLPTTSQYSTQFSNQSVPHMVPSVVSSVSHQFPSQILSNQPKTTNILPSLQSTSSPYPTQSSKDLPVPSTFNQLSSQMFSNNSKSDVSPFQSTPSPYQPPAPINVTTVSSTVKQFSPSFNQPVSTPLSLQSISNPVLTQPINSEPKPNAIIPPISSPRPPNMIPLDSSTTNQFPPQMLNVQPRLDAGPSKNSITCQYPSQTLNNQPMSGIMPPVSQQAPNQYPSQYRFSDQPKPNTFPLQPVPNQYPSQLDNNQSVRQVLQKPNYTVPLNNQFYNQTNLAQPSHHNQWPLHSNLSNPMSGIMPPVSQQAPNQYPPQYRFSDQSKPNTFPPQLVTNQYTSQLDNNQLGRQVLQKPNYTVPNMNLTSQHSPITSLDIQNKIKSLFPQQKSTNESSNQQTQKLGSQMLPPMNNYYNQVQGNEHVQQTQPLAAVSNPNVQLASKGYPQQSNMGIPNQINYHQSNVVHGQDLSYRPEQNPSVVQQGFTKSWVSLLLF